MPPEPDPEPLPELDDGEGVSVGELTTVAPGAAPVVAVPEPVVAVAPGEAVLMPMTTGTTVWLVGKCD